VAMIFLSIRHIYLPARSSTLAVLMMNNSPNRL